VTILQGVLPRLCVPVESDYEYPVQLQIPATSARLFVHRQPAENECQFQFSGNLGLKFQTSVYPELKT